MKCTCDNHPDCKHEWDHHGKSKYYAQCPMCRCFLRKTERVLDVEDDN